MPTTAKTTKTPTTLLKGTTVDKLVGLRNKKRDLEASVKSLEGQIEELQSQLLEEMEAAGVDKFSGKLGTVSISTNVVANVEDWDALYPYIAKNKLWHLLQRRVSDPAYRELLDAGKKVPGVQPFSKKRLNLRAAS
jgi:hypothetical protein